MAPLYYNQHSLYQHSHHNLLLYDSRESSVVTEYRSPPLQSILNNPPITERGNCTKRVPHTLCRQSFVLLAQFYIACLSPRLYRKCYECRCTWEVLMSIFYRFAPTRLGKSRSERQQANKTKPTT